MDNNRNWNEFPDEDEDDYLRDIRLAQETEELYAEDCHIAISGIRQMGFEQWFYSHVQTTNPDQRQTKIDVVNNLIKYYSRKDIEDYETCLWLKTNLDKEMIRNYEVEMTEEAEEFYDWSTSGNGWSRRGGKQRS